MSFLNLGENIDELTDGIKSFVNVRLEYFELKFLREFSYISARLAGIILALFIFVVFLIMLSFGGAYLIGRSLDNVSYGFFIMAGFYLVIFILLLIFGRRLFQGLMVREISKEFFKAKKSIKFKDK